MKVLDFSELIIPTLKILSESKREMNIRDIDCKLIERIGRNNLNLTLKHKDTNQSEFSYRASWARTYLKKF